MLDAYYNDSYWKNYIDLYNRFWNNGEYQQLLLNDLQNNIDVAKVIYGIFEDDSLEWINTEIPALGNLKPKNCLEDENLLKRLKTLLTRMSR